MTRAPSKEGLNAGIAYEHMHNNEEILKKAIEKAVKNGYKKYADELWELLHENNYYGTIFSHDFAKAFWGESKCDCMQTPNGTLHKDNCKERDWQYHLQQMVISDDPVKYLKKFL